LRLRALEYRMLEDRDLGEKILRGIRVSGRFRRVDVESVDGRSSAMRTYETWRDDVGRWIQVSEFDAASSVLTITDYYYLDEVDLPQEMFEVPPHYTIVPSER
jgi:hypothetical protein